MAHPNSNQPANHTFNSKVSHSRSLSQPTFFANNCLPPLSPIPPGESSIASNFEETNAPFLTPSFSRENLFRKNDNLPPRRIHRRSNSDFPLEFSAMIQSSPQLVPISGGNGQKNEMNINIYEKNKTPEVMCEMKSEGEVVDDLVNSLMNLDNLEYKEKESMNSREGIKRSAPGDLVPPPRHFRSLSMDSAFGNFALGNESPKLQIPPCNQLSPSNSVSDNSAKLNLEFGNGEFNEAEMKKIAADERLAEIAVSDPKRAKRILANRQSAARSKERKMRYISELEHKVQTLQTETTTLSAQITMLQKDYGELMNQNNELKYRVKAMEQQAQIRDDLHEALTAEVQRLRFAKIELREEGRAANVTSQKHAMWQNLHPPQHQQPNQIQRLSVSTSTTSSTASAAPASA